MHFTLYVLTGHWGPNPIKVAIFLEQLGLEYTVKSVDMNSSDKEKGVKGEAYRKLCPNGRTPTLIDHKNNDFVVWESGACLWYLENKYDSSKKYGAASAEEQAQLDQWLFFQVTGFSPVLGNLWYALTSWKDKYGEDAPKNVVTRFYDETLRVLPLFEEQLKKQTEQYGEDKAWLVLDHMTVVDFSIIPWFYLLPKYGHVMSVDMSKFPHILKYVEKAEALPTVQKVRAQVDH